MYPNIISRLENNVKINFGQFLTNILSRKGENPMEVESKCIDEMQKITETVKSIL